MEQALEPELRFHHERVARLARNIHGAPAIVSHCCGVLTEEPIHGIPTQSERSLSCRPSDDEIRRQARLNSLDNELQPDPELAEGPASGAKIAMFAVAIAVVLGAVFYGLNNTSVNQATTSPASQTAQTQPANPAAPPGMRDVTPRANSEPGHDHRRRLAASGRRLRPSPSHRYESSRPTAAGQQVTADASLIR